MMATEVRVSDTTHRFKGTFEIYRYLVDESNYTAFTTLTHDCPWFFFNPQRREKILNENLQNKTSWQLYEKWVLVVVYNLLRSG